MQPYSRELTVKSISVVTVGASAPLATIPDRTIEITIWGESGITMAYGAVADANSVPVPTSPLTLEVTASDLALIQFFASSKKLYIVTKTRI